MYVRCADLLRARYLRKGERNMSHELFVFLSYAAVVVVLGIVMCWIILDGKARKAELARLEAAGVKRRSEQNT